MSNAHPITRLEVTIKARKVVSWPHFSGSTLRGAFGRALRLASCMTGQPTCKGCQLRNGCAYGVVFDPAPPAEPLHPSFQDGVPRYMVQPPGLGACQLPAGQVQTFNLVLLPGAHTHLKLIEHVLKVAVEQELTQPNCFKLESINISQHHVDTLNAANVKTEAITLRWHVPLRLQIQGKPISNPNGLNTNILIRAMLRRQLQWLQLTNQHQTPTSEQLNAAADCKLDISNLCWHDMRRFSGTQNDKIPLGGLIGSATVQGPAHALSKLMPLLRLCEQLHIGKETVMGLGRYELSATT